ncbi:hypothetical protein HUG15_10090 [Salicibibacter cibarius]|uniref:Uncharacterized protein n=1 Tax=Salicibibacter cibarius TaxID=2743000 RepID=A0A7T6Z2P8_9BACI|nr:hypothetical protein [Salicibibacter cibarius]QQK75879.1 hypothetical protein HUG15_10090 [Salicibibacter cibarius]
MLAVFVIGAVTGALLFYQRLGEWERWMLIMLVIFAGMGYLGFSLSNGYFSFVSEAWVQAFWFVGTLIFIASAMMAYRPRLGFFGRNDYRIWASVIALFFLSGGLVNVWVSAVFTYIFSILVFATGLVIGFLAQSYLYAYWPRFEWLPYVPLLVLIFVSAGKLL